MECAVPGLVRWSWVGWGDKSDLHGMWLNQGFHRYGDFFLHHYLGTVTTILLKSQLISGHIFTCYFF